MSQGPQTDGVRGTDIAYRDNIFGSAEHDTYGYLYMYMHMQTIPLSIGTISKGLGVLSTLGFEISIPQFFSCSHDENVGYRILNIPGESYYDFVLFCFFSIRSDIVFPNVKQSFFFFFFDVITKATTRIFRRNHD